MVTIVSANDEPKLVFCLSTDAKPDTVPNGSRCVEIDTGKESLYDAENDIWYEQGASSDNTPADNTPADNDPPADDTQPDG
mgnify:CR=1 FL=1